MQIGPSTRTRFLRAFRGGGAVAVLCWLNGCSHCETFKPVWRAAQRLLRHGGGTAGQQKLIMADCERAAWDNMPPTAPRPYAFPVIQAYRRGRLVAELPGARSLPETLRFLKAVRDG